MRYMLGPVQQLHSTPSLEDFARAALTGDKSSLEEMMRALQGNIFGLALRCCATGRMLKTLRKKSWCASSLDCRSSTFAES